ncbi:hypothetical protein DFJ77DRAFT_466810 [Powellomyces hirtus]|nr:hypothetical protein DFJ77DRAFT_466810 [Powellomyces hirtus]
MTKCIFLTWLSVCTETLGWKVADVPLTANDAAAPARYEHIAAIVQRRGGSPQLLIMYGAGDEGVRDDVWAFDLETHRWTEWQTKGTKPCGRTIHSAGLVRTPAVDDKKSNGDSSYEKSRLYVFGGGVASDAAVPDASVYCLDVDNMLWIKVTHEQQQTSPPTRLGHSFTAIGTKIYLFGGLHLNEAYNDLWIFDTVMRTWTLQPTSGQIPSARSGHTTTVSGSKLYVFGGFSKSGKPEVYDHVYVLDTDSFVWHKPEVAALPPGPPAPSLDHDACVVIGMGPRIGSKVEEVQVPVQTESGNALLVFGGMDFSGMHNSLYSLDV